MRAAELSPVAFAVVSGNRTLAEQRYLYAQGRTRPGLKITWTLRSNHMGGNAVDLSAVDINGNPSNMDPRTWNAVHYMPIIKAVLAAGKDLGLPIYSGYMAWKKDWGHFQTVHT